MSTTTESTEYRQKVDKILSAATTLKHGIDLSEYITKTTQTTANNTVDVFTVNKTLYSDICKLVFGAGYAGMKESEMEIFLESCYNAVKKFRAKIYESCLATWQVIYSDIPLKLEMVIGDSFFFARGERATCLNELQKAINFYGLENLLMQTPISFKPERISDKLPYGTSVRWIASLPVNILSSNLTFSYLEQHTVTVFDMFYGYQMMSRIQAMLELELLQNYKVKPNDILKTPYTDFTLYTNTTQRCLYWAEQS